MRRAYTMAQLRSRRKRNGYKAKEIKDISGLTHGIGWCAPQQGACKLTLNVKEGIIQEALVETIGCSGMTHSAAMAAEILPGRTILEALNTDLVCDAINTAMRELFLQIVYGRTQSAFSEEGLPIGAGLEDLGKGLRSQVGTMYGTLKKGPRYLEMAEGYVTGIALDADDQIIGYQFVNLGKMTDFIKKGDDPNNRIRESKRPVRPCGRCSEDHRPASENNWKEVRKQWHYLNPMKEELTRSMRVLNSYGIASIEEAEKITKGCRP